MITRTNASKEGWVRRSFIVSSVARNDTRERINHQGTLYLIAEIFFLNVIKRRMKIFKSFLVFVESREEGGKLL